MAPAARISSMVFPYKLSATTAKTTTAAPAMPAVHTSGQRIFSASAAV